MLPAATLAAALQTIPTRQSNRNVVASRCPSPTCWATAWCARRVAPATALARWIRRALERATRRREGRRRCTSPQAQSRPSGVNVIFSIPKGPTIALPAAPYTLCQVTVNLGECPSARGRSAVRRVSERSLGDGEKRLGSGRAKRTLGRSDCATRRFLWRHQGRPRTIAWPPSRRVHSTWWPHR